MTEGQKIRKQIDKLEQELEKVLEQARLKWLQQICKDARHYNFKSLGELIAWIVDHASDISHAENEPSAATS